jgi:sugar phosphate isomerase/epimerase
LVLRLRRPMLAFSSLACPEWGALEVVERAMAMGFGGIEWRGGDSGHVAHLSSGARREVRGRMEEAGLVSVAVTAYTNLADPDPEVRTASIRVLEHHAEVASDLGAGSVRAFPGHAADAPGEDTIIERVSRALGDAAERLESTSIRIALEAHDDLMTSASIGRVLQAVGRTGVGAVWDIGNSWISGEHPSVGFPHLREWITYVQVKDGVGQGPWWRPVDLGFGEVPLRAALRLLLNAGGSVPPVSIEWERPWHPDLRPAADALPDGLTYLERLVAEYDQDLG